MRRKINSNKSLYLIIVIAFMTISSYFFDQLVIRNEDNLRNAKIELDKVNLETKSLNTISSQLTVMHDHVNYDYLNFMRLRNYWMKNILLITYYNTYPYLKDKDIIETFSEDNYFDLDYLIKYRFIEHYQEVLIAHNVIEEKLYEIYGWNIKYFRKYLDENNNYNGPSTSFEKAWSEIIHTVNIKNFEFYARIIYEEDRIKYAIENFEIKNWKDIHTFSYKLTQELLNYIEILNDDIRYIDDFIVIKEDQREKIITSISTISTFKNYYILSSIICQILSLLFLLILFKYLLKLKSNLKVPINQNKIK